MQRVVIIGAGPAGLTAAYNLLKNSNKYQVIILEKESMCGGISKTVNYHGNRMDLGGHRFFTKDKRVMGIWKEILPIQGKPSSDDILLNRTSKLFSDSDIDPNKSDNVLLVRNRVSRIYYNHHFFDYPISLKWTTIKNLGFAKTMISGFSYLKSIVFKKKETNLENFYINRFGKKLYSIFFKGYTEKLWGRLPKEIDSSWGSQRVKGISIIEVLKNALGHKSKEVSLIDEFYYPKYGPGEMWEQMAKKIEEMGGLIVYNANVTKINKKNNKINSIIYNNKELKLDYLISSMPIKDLIRGMNNVPHKVFEIASGLPYRDFITVGLILDKLRIKNETKIKTINNIIPDCWIYVQSTDVKLGRIQVFNNWSCYLPKDTNTISLGLEYFCNEKDEFWKLKDSKLKEYAYNDLLKMDIIDENTKVLDYHVEHVMKAYPAYFDTYKDFDILKNYLNKFDNLFLIGRNGEHRYNNMDHSMLTAIECTNNILNNIKTKDNIWNVNTESEYHEKVISNENN